METANIGEEFSIEVPRPIQAPPAGRFYAIEIHAIEWYIPYHIRCGQRTHVLASLTTVSRVSREALISNCGDPDNVWWFVLHAHAECGDASGVALHTSGPHNRRVDYTDDLGHGKLFVGSEIFLQLLSHLYEDPVEISVRIDYTFTTVSCLDYAQALSAQLSSEV